MSGVPRGERLMRLPSASCGAARATARAVRDLRTAYSSNILRAPRLLRNKADCRPNRQSLEQSEPPKGKSEHPRSQEMACVSPGSAFLTRAASRLKPARLISATDLNAGTVLRRRLATNSQPRTTHYVEGEFAMAALNFRCSGKDRVRHKPWGSVSASRRVNVPTGWPLSQFQREWFGP